MDILDSDNDDEEPSLLHLLNVESRLINLTSFFSLIESQNVDDENSVSDSDDDTVFNICHQTRRAYFDSDDDDTVFNICHQTRRVYLDSDDDDTVFNICHQTRRVYLD